MNEKPRRRFRFSLRTLLIALLLVGAGIGIRVHWVPWYPVTTVPVPLDSQYLCSPDDKFVAACVNDGEPTIRVWDLSSGALVSQFSSKGFTRGFSFSRDGKQIITTDEQKGLHDIETWDILTGRLLTRQNFKYLYYHKGLSLSPDGAILFETSPVRVWDTETGSITLRFHPPRHNLFHDSQLAKKIDEIDNLSEFCGRLWIEEDTAVFSCASSLDANLILTCIDGAGMFRLWNRSSGRKLRDVPLPEKMTYIVRAKFSPDSKFVAIFAPPFPTLIFDTQTGTLISQLPVQNQLGEFANDGKRYFVHGIDVKGDVDSEGYRHFTDAFFWLYDVASGGCIRRIEADWIIPTADARRALITHGGKESNISLIDFDNDTPLFDFPIKSLSLNDAWISSDGTHAVLNNHELQIWHRRRPEHWWGIFWLPEFWFTLFLSGGLFWSLRRDRGVGGKTPAKL